MSASSLRPSPGVSPASGTQRRGRGSRRFGAGGACVLVLGVLLIAVVLLGRVHGVVGTAIAVVLPWLGCVAAILVLFAFTLRRRWWLVVAPVLVWVITVSPAVTWIPAAMGEIDAKTDLVVASQNVEADSGTADASANALAARGADVIALTELDADSRRLAEETLEESHPYSYLVGTVGLWSTVPIVDARPLELGLGWQRALNAEIATDTGNVSVYVVHAASFRPGEQADRDAMLAALGDEIAADPAEQVIALGDFNAATTDPALSAVRTLLSEAKQKAPGISFTWPAAFPVVRIDHIFQRGFDSRGGEAFRAGDSDHFAVIAALAPVDSTGLNRTVTS
ncbi:endonuclease/exonuclease/phosphatase family protein [Leucobacter sp. 1207-22]|uniref:endonuclease/exonuclease/phosphatase family protein n=1 Tax=Leucobacter sp. 1207-22 TaxID=2604456 RepID=UPI0040638355